MIEINKNPSPRTLCQFSLAGGVFAALVGYLVLESTGSLTTAILIWVSGAAVAGLGAVRPPCVRIVYLGMSYLAAPIGIVISLIVLGIVYYVVVTPTGVIMRLFGRDPMQRRADRAAGSYWRERKQTAPERYFRQF
ncbi:MAG: SxtJ family membrane protein [Phycisphaerae bacterium]|jgi:hypothetical protein|nr:SxtJ family membrane protein [Phycisphaerae bacterium]